MCGKMLKKFNSKKPGERNKFQVTENVSDTTENIGVVLPVRMLLCVHTFLTRQS